MAHRGVKIKISPGIIGLWAFILVGTNAVTTTTQTVTIATTTSSETTTTSPLTTTTETTSTLPLTTTTVTTTTTLPLTTTPGEEISSAYDLGVPGEQLFRIIHKDHVTAMMDCTRLGGYLLSYVSKTMYADVVDFASEYYPADIVYWSSYTRVGPTDWESPLFDATQDSFSWKRGYDSSDPGNCLAMEILPTGIEHFPADCSQTLPSICHVIDVNDNKMYKRLPSPNIFNTTDYFSFIPDVNNSMHCGVLCSNSDPCVAFSYNTTVGECHHFTDIMQSLEEDYTQIVPNTDIYNVNDCCYANGTLIPSCCYSGSAFDPDCITVYGGPVPLGSIVSCHSTSREVQIPFWKFQLYTKQGCTRLRNPNNGSIELESTPIGEKARVSCGKAYSTPFSRYPTDNLTCMENYRWANTPRCILNVARRCPLGWAEFYGACYLVGSDADNQTWDGSFDACAAHNANPFSLTYSRELDFLTRLLRYKGVGTVYWTGIQQIPGSSNVINADYSLLTWTLKKLTKNLNPGMAALELIDTGNDTKWAFVNKERSEKYPYICKMGSSYLGDSCEGNNWCRGGSICSLTCMCRNQSRFANGNDFLPTTGCDRRWIPAGNYLLHNTATAVDWNTALEYCHSLDASVFTPIDHEMEDLAMAHLYTSGVGLQSWTGLYTLQGNDGIFSRGYSPYMIINATRLQWRSMPILSGVNVTNLAVYMELNALGIRLYKRYVYGIINVVCLKLDETVASTMFAETDNFPLTPWQEFNYSMSAVNCRMRCLSLPNCLSYRHDDLTDYCALFNVDSTGSNPQPGIVMEKIAGCKTPYEPNNGALGTVTGQTFGSTADYTCDVLYMVEPEHAGPLTCGNNGRWSHLPICRTEIPECPIGFEQYKASCYYFYGVITGYYGFTGTPSAFTSRCGAIGAHPLQIYSMDEHLFVSKILDSNYRQNVWIDGNDELVDMYFVWSTDPYEEMTYQNFMSCSSGDEYNCISLRRSFNYTDQGMFYMTTSACSAELSYMCKMNSVLNVGYVGCGVYGAYSCKMNAYCDQDKCICQDGYFQVGLDNVDTTKCYKILPVKSPSSCMGYDELCLNNSVCINNQCQCPLGTYQNGKDGSYSTTCDDSQSPCPQTNEWFFFNNHCFAIYPSQYIPGGCAMPENLEVCGSKRAFLASVKSEQQNTFVRNLGSVVRNLVWIGYYCLPTEGCRDRDLSLGSYTNFGYGATNLTSGNTFMDYAGTWRLVNNFDPRQLKKYQATGTGIDVACERYPGCLQPPTVTNMDLNLNRPNFTEVNDTFSYECDVGFMIAPPHTGRIQCISLPSGASGWTAPPSCTAIRTAMFNIKQTIYGDMIQSATMADVDACADACYYHQLCGAFDFNDLTSNCITFMNASETNNGKPLVTHSTDMLYIRKGCGAIQELDNGYVFSYDGNPGQTLPGNKIQYACDPHYKIHQFTPPVLTCGTDGFWDNPLPTCVSRFNRTVNMKILSTGTVAHYYNVYSIEACERICMEHANFRCMMAQIRHGVCWVMSNTYHQITDYCRNDPFTASTLLDSDLDKFDVFIGKSYDVAPDANFTFASPEVCAQQCLYLDCASFVHRKDLLECWLFMTLPGSMVADVLEAYTFVKQSGCSSPPVVPNTAMVEQVKVSGMYSIGDIVQYTCTINGEELADDHDGFVVCQSTGKWSTLPVCRNDCPQGWLSVNKVCYKVFETPVPFWDAHRTCHSLDSGLVNLASVDERSDLSVVWAKTLSSMPTIWIGLFSDLDIWKWTEQQGTEVSDVAPTLGAPTGAIAGVYNTGADDIVSDVTTSSHAFMCTRFVGRLQCPSGWVQYKSRCYKLQAAATFDGAKTNCGALGGTLAPIINEFVRYLFRDILVKTNIDRAYVGIEADINEGLKRDDGTPVTMDHKLYTEGDANVRRCGTVRSNKAYELYSCTASLPSFCQRPLSEIGEAIDYSNLPCATSSYCNHTDLWCAGAQSKINSYQPVCTGRNCQPPWLYWRGNCYLPELNTSVNLMDANSFCQTRGARVTLPNDMQENLFLFHYVEAHSNFFENRAIHIGAVSHTDIPTLSNDVAAVPSVKEIQILPTVLNVEYVMNSRLWGLAKLTPVLSFQGSFICEKQAVPDHEKNMMYEGCYKYVPFHSMEDLSHNSLVNSAMTVDICVDHCRSLNFKYAGLSGTECVCGNAHGQHGFSADCTTPCAGDGTQMCGQTSVALSVYRTSGRACADSMVFNPLDNSKCYSFVSYSSTMIEAQFGCSIMGGHLMFIENPIIEETLYDQLFRQNSNSSLQLRLGLYRNPLSDDYSYLNGQNNNYADWVNIRYENRKNYRLPSVGVNMTNNGFWNEYEDKAPIGFACMFSDNTRTTQGSNLMRTYQPGGKSLITTEEGLFPLDAQFDFGCLRARHLCPQGFTLSLWFSIFASAPDRTLLTSGDCTTQYLASEGFCIYYRSSMGSMVILDVTGNNSSVSINFTIPVGQLTNLQVVFLDTGMVEVFMGGVYMGPLTPYVLEETTGSTTLGVLVPDSEAGVIEVGNITVTTSVPDHVVLSGSQSPTPSNIGASSNNLYVKQSNDLDLENFHTWGMNFSSFSGPGVDENGLYVSTKALRYDLGKMPSDWLHDANLAFSMAFWVNIPVGLKDTMTLIQYGRSYSDTPGVLITYNGLTNLLSVKLYLEYETFMADVPYFPNAQNHWVHLALVVDTGAVSLYASGQYLQDVPKMGYGGGINKGSHKVSAFVGNGMCELYATIFGMSCYSRWNVAEADEIWEAEDYSLYTRGGHNVNVEDEEELEFVKKYLHDFTAFTGTFSPIQGSKFKQWRNTRGYKQDFIYFPTPDPLDASQTQIGPYNNFIKMFFEPTWESSNDSIAMISGVPEGMFPDMNETDCSGNFTDGFNDTLCANQTMNSTESTVTFTTTMGTTTVPPTVFYKVAPEVNRRGPQMRPEKNIYCLSGWKYIHGKCYRTYASTGTYARQMCSKYRGRLARIQSLEHQMTLANWYRRVSTLPAYIGLHLHISPQTGNLSHVYSDGYPVEFQYWKQPLTYTSTDLSVVMDCTSSSYCPWVPNPGTAGLKVICERDQDNLECGPEGRKFKDKCVYLRMSTVTTTTCSSRGFQALVLKTNADAEEFAHLFSLSTAGQCLTDAITVDAVNAAYQTSSETPFFLASDLPGAGAPAAGQCIAVGTGGLYRRDCISATCAACEAPKKAGFRMDNIKMQETVFSDADVLQLYEEDVYPEKSWHWDMNNLNATSGQIKGAVDIVKFHTVLPITTTLDRILQLDGNSSLETDKTLGSVLRIASPDTPALFTFGPADTNSSNDCLTNIQACKQGISIMFWLKGENLSDATLFSTQENGTTGVKIWIDEWNDKLHVSVMELNYEWRGWVYLIYSSWIHIIVTWQTNVGIQFYLNFNLVHHVTHRVKKPVFEISSVDSISLLVGHCSNDSLPELLMDDLIINNQMMTKEQIFVVKAERDIVKYLDFNEIDAMSQTNVFIERNTSLSEVRWRNSLFQDYVFIENSGGEVPALDGNLAAHCLSRTDLCTSWFTTSFWLMPYDMEQDQIFLYAGTQLSPTLDSVALKVWYDSVSDQYVLELLYDKTQYVVTFYLYLYNWHHIVVMANLPDSDIQLYVDGQPGIMTVTTSFIVDRIPPEGALTFFRIGVKGRFAIDDIKHSSMKEFPWDLYVLKSCHEYDIAQFRDTQDVFVDDNILDGIQEATNVSCTFTDYDTYYHISLDVNETYANTSVTYYDNSPIVSHDYGVMWDAALLTNQGLVITLDDNRCLGSIAHCFFGLTVSLWVNLRSQSYNGSDFVLLEVGGDARAGETGLTVFCGNQSAHNFSILCEVVLLNDTRIWKTEFHLQINEWTHLAIVWNQYRYMKVYKNGHSLDSLGIPVVQYSIPPNETSPIGWWNGTGSVCIGCSMATGPYDFGSAVLLVDDVYLYDMDMTTDEVKQKYGQHQRCQFPWKFLEETGRCYFASDTKAMFEQAELVCQSMGGNLAYEGNMVVHNALTSLVFEIVPPTLYYLALKELPHADVRIRWYNGYDPDYTTLNVGVTGYRKCGAITPAGWTFKNCMAIYHYLCDKPSWYIRDEDLVLLYNSIYLDPDRRWREWQGQLPERVRGFNADSLVLNNSIMTFDLQDRCQVNQDLCHNGHSISLWLFWPANSSENKQVLYTTFSSQSSHGISLYIQRTGLVYEFGVEHRHSDNFTTLTYPVSVQRWTNIVVSVSNTSEVFVYLNSKLAPPKTQVFLGAGAPRAVGEVATVTVGGDYNGSSVASVVFDNLTVYEYVVLDPLRLQTTVYERFPVLHLSLDDFTLYKSTSDALLTEGRFGNALVFTGPTPVEHIGLFQHDCLFNNEFCLNGLTIALWIKPSASVGGDHYVISSYAMPSGFHILHSPATSLFYIQTDDDVEMVKVPFTLISDVWSHVTLTWSNKTSYTLLTNGVEDVLPHTITAATVKTKDQRPLKLGGGDFRGGVDDLWFLSRSMTPQEQVEVYINSTYVTMREDWELEEMVNGSLSPHAVEGISGNAYHINSGLNWLSLEPAPNSTCLTDIDRCVHGFTLSLYMNFRSENDIDQLLLTTGGHNSSGLGLALQYTAMNKSLPFRRYFEVSLLTTANTYTTWFNMQWGVWNQLTITYHRMFGLRVFVDGKLSPLSDSGMPRAVAPTVTEQRLVIGEPILSTTGSKGVFVVDKMRILDRAIFGDVYTYNSELWFHWLHADLDPMLVQSSASVQEMTRDECQKACTNASCGAFRVCGDQTYSTCEMYHTNVSGNINHTFIIPDGQCDLFTGIESERSYEVFGCIPASATALMNQIPTNDTVTISTCIDGCSYNYTFASVVSGICYCSDDSIRPSVTVSADTNQSFVCPEVLLYQVSGLRDFLSLMEPITVLNVSVDPGVIVIEGNVFNMSMQTNNMTFAGYRIDFGDGTPVFYTGRNHTLHSFSNVGMYAVEVVAMNEISVYREVIYIYVFTKVTGMSIENVALTGTYTDFNVTAYLIGGNNVTCELTYSDGFMDSMMKVNTSEPYVFTYQYKEEGIQVQNMTCYNNVSQVMNTSLIETVHPVINFTLSAPTGVVYKESFNLTWTAFVGTNVTMVVYERFDGPGMTLFLPNMTNDGSYEFVYNFNYTSIGEHVLNVSLENIVTPLFYEFVVLDIDAEITSINVNTAALFFTSFTNVTFDIACSNGSNFDVFMDYGDGLNTYSEFVEGLVENYNQSLVNVYEVDGVRSLFLYCNNSVSALNMTQEIYIEHSVEAVNLTDMYNISGIVNFTFSLVPNTSFAPTNALFSFIYGDGSSDINLNFDMTNGELLLSHDYVNDGLYDISVTIYNNVSSVTFNQTIQVGQRITGLALIAPPSTLVGNNFNLNITAASGSNIQYLLDLGDGNISYCGVYSWPDLQVDLSHSYPAQGSYLVNVTAFNLFSSVSYAMTIYVQEEISGIIVTGDRISKVDYRLTFQLYFTTLGTDTCIVFYPGDGTEYLLGASVCPSMPEYQHLAGTFVFANTTYIEVNHTFTYANTFSVRAVAKNFVSAMENTHTIIILEFPCTFPYIQIPGFSTNMSYPTETYTGTTLIIRALADTICYPVIPVIFDWHIAQIAGTGFDPSIISLPSLPYLWIEGNTLPYGIYHINVTVFIEGYPMFNHTSNIYIEAIPSPLHLQILGDDLRTVPLGMDVELNGELSTDPDYPIHLQPFGITWYCWFSAGTFDPNLHEASPSLVEVGGTGCHTQLGNGKGLVVQLPAANFAENEVHTFVGAMSVNNRTTWKMHKVRIVAAGTDLLSILCVENCGDISSPSLPIRLIGQCETCTFENRLSRVYLWEIFKVEGGMSTLVSGGQFDIDYTRTGLAKPSLSIVSGALEPGSTYDFRFSTGMAYTVRRIITTSPPYNGVCSVNRNQGVALSTKFTVTCDGYVDEARRPARDITVDSQLLVSLNYNFMYRYNDSMGTLYTMPVFETQGTYGKSPEIMLPPGLEEYNYEVQLIIQIADGFECVTEEILSVQVLPSKLTPSEQLNSLEFQLCAAEKDMMCMLIFSKTICDMINSNNVSTAEEINTRINLISVMQNNSDLIQDSNLAVTSMAVMKNLQSDISDLNTQNLGSMGTVYGSMVGSFGDSISRPLTSDEKQSLGKSILANIIEFCQRTKYNPGCDSDICDERMIRGNAAIDLIQFTKNITKVLLEGTVPEEYGYYLEIPQGDCKLLTQRRETMMLFNSTLEMNGIQIADIPDFSSSINMSLATHIDVEILVSDNLYTTDQSVVQSKTRTTSINLYNAFAEKISVNNLPTPIAINTYPWQLDNSTFTPVELGPCSDGLFFIELRLNESMVIPVLMLELNDGPGCVKYYLKVGSIPGASDYHVKGEFCDGDQISGANGTAMFMKQFDEASVGNKLLTTSLHKVYLGLCSSNSTNITTHAVSFHVRGCNYWNDTYRSWAYDGLQMGTLEDAERVVCLTNHLTSFSVNFFVPPNTINFSTVFSKFDPNNIAVLATVCGVIFLYMIFILLLRREDKKDPHKWAIYPLKDNVATDIYHYHVTVYTGLRKNAGTKSRVFFVLGGEEGDTEVRELCDTENREIKRATVLNYLLSVQRPLGELTFLRIWHDNSGKGEEADWYLNLVSVKDLQTNLRYDFVCDTWLALTKGDGQIEKLLPVAGNHEIMAFDHAFYQRTRKDITDSHLWVSVLSRPTQSVFTRVQRWSCCLSLLFLTMVTNAMWYQTRDDGNQQNVHLGPFTFSAQEVTTSIMSSFIVVPVSLAIITLFKKSKRKPPKNAVNGKYSDSLPRKPVPLKGLDRSDTSSSLREGSVTPGAIDTALMQTSQMCSTWQDFEHKASRLMIDQSRSTRHRKKNKCQVPHWGLYVAWLLVFLSVAAAGFFTILYSFEWGTEKSSKWLTAFLLSFVESVILIQPLKVVVVAVVLIILFKKPSDDTEEEAYVHEVVLPELDNDGVPLPSRVKFPEHRKPYQTKPRFQLNIEEMRLHRKRVNRLFTIGRELMIYMFYLTVVAVMAYENRDKNAFRTYDHLRNMLVDPITKLDKKLMNVSTPESLWDWSENVLIPQLYTEAWYNGYNTTDTTDYISDHVHFRVGTPRLRQARVESDDCKVPAIYRKYFKTCYLDYGFTNYEGKDYSEGWAPYSANGNTSQWTYNSALDLKGYPIIGIYGSYSGGGYVASLGADQGSARNMMDYLKTSGWVDRQTRAIMVETNIFNPNINLFTTLCLTLEFPASGSIVPYIEIQPVIVYRYVGASAIFILVFDILFLAFTLHYMYNLYKRLKEERWGFFTKFWNIIDFVNMCLSFCVIAFYAMHFVMVELTMAQFREDKDTYLNLQHIITWNYLSGVLLAFLLFLSMIKLLLLFRFNSKITQLSGTLKKISKPFMSFMVVFTSTFVGFATFGYLVFGCQDRGYNNFITSLETLMSMLMMKMEIENMMLVNGLLGSAYLFLFVLFVVFILLNMLLSIINDAYTEVREDPSFLPDDPELASFFFQEMKRFILGQAPEKKFFSPHIRTTRTLEEKISRIDRRLLKFVQTLRKDY